MPKLDLINVKADFTSYVAALQDDLKQRDSWTDLNEGSTGETLIEHNSAIGTYNQWSIEQSLKEGFFDTANRDSTIYALTRMLGVRIMRKLPAAQIITLNRFSQDTLPITGTVTIPEYSQFNVLGVDYFNRTPITFANDISGNPTSAIDKVFIHQGSLYYRNYVSDGTDFQQLSIPAISPMSISDLDIRMIIGGVTWTRIIDGLWNYGPSATVFVDDTLGTGDVVLQFGNGINGAKPAYGSSIEITYVETLGASSPITSVFSSVTLNAILNSTPPQGVKGFVTRDNVLQSAEGMTLSSVSIQISSITDALPIFNLPVGSIWSKSFVGLQIEEVTGVGIGTIVHVSGRDATVSIVNNFKAKLLAAGTWILTTTATGHDERPARYYKATASMLFKANCRAVTTDDHIAYCLSYPGVGDVCIRFERDLLLKMMIPLWDKSAEPPINPVETVDYILTTTDAHPKLMNLIWVSILSDTGVNWTNSEWAAFLTWFDQYKYKGSILKPQNPIKDARKLQVKIMCFLRTDLSTVAASARTFILSVFSTSQQILNKRIALTDISNILKTSIPEIDYIEFFDPTPAGDLVPASDFIPIPISVHPVTGIPTPPAYISVSSSDLVIETGYSSRNTVNYVDPSEAAGNFTKVTRADGSIQLIPN
jgi:hypothetical protein